MRIKVAVAVMVRTEVMVRPEVMIEAEVVILAESEARPEVDLSISGEAVGLLLTATALGALFPFIVCSILFFFL